MIREWWTFVPRPPPASRPYGIVVSNTNNSAVGLEFESRTRHGCVCKCTVPSRHGGTLNSRRAASALVRLVEGEERWEASDHPQDSPLELG
ncbi:hypothetical protein TNCV_1959701 [Trichonephila clavipes]|nr:hypothetical protein TNCV_1959701 [Trichonephila clavipes]